MANNIKIVVENLNFYYGNDEALKDVSMLIQEFWLWEIYFFEGLEPDE
jgi:ABC-type phosphate transport system ATPase subunit